MYYQQTDNAESDSEAPDSTADEADLLQLPSRRAGQFAAEDGDHDMSGSPTRSEGSSTELESEWTGPTFEEIDGFTRSPASRDGHWHYKKIRRDSNH